MPKQSNPPQRLDFVALEHEVQRFWDEHNIVESYLKKNKHSEERFSFLDGPITANNPMGVHHAWGRTLKDIFQRYHTMKGHRQRYQNGFDCQGLWVEVEVEKELGLKNKQDIENLVEGDRTASIAKFVELCKERVRKYAAIQTQQSKRLGYWMDWDHSYYTMADHNNYAIWSFLKTCHERGWLYLGRDSVPWCPRCGTAISQQEILTEEYKELTHTSVYLGLTLKEREGESLLIWTTTPWTIPANIFVAVHPEFEYSLVHHGSKKYWVLTSRVESVFGKEAKVERNVRGEELVNLHYTGPFDDMPIYKEASNKPYFHEILAAPELVGEDEGTGLVHIAPAAGGEDYRLASREYKYDDLIIEVVGEDGNYLEGLSGLVGQNAQADPSLVLDKLGDFLYKTEEYTHRYPVCWRCKTELIWRVVDEWYIAMDRPDPTDGSKRTYREQMMDVAKKIRWIPEWGLARELDWLRNMQDWMISKKRYWGLALPIYPCSCGEITVVGGKEELEKMSASGWQEFNGHSPHRPWVDQVTITCPKCGKPVQRVLDTGNPWLDAGIVPISTLFPVEQFGKDGNIEGAEGSFKPDLDYFKDWFPVDFVTEGFAGQFKNWFYALLAMSTALEKTNPFKALLGHGLVKDEHGEEMHKSKGNSIEFNEAAEKAGVDAMRWIYASQSPELNVNFGYGPADEVKRRVFSLLWNSYVYLNTYTEEEFKPSEPHPQSVLDRWLLARLDLLISTADAGYAEYDTPTVVRACEEFLEDLSTWYIRRSRERFASQDSSVFESVQQHLCCALATLIQIMSPITPHFSDYLYMLLGGEGSVHLSGFPIPSKEIDLEVIDEMQLARALVSQGLAKRAEAKVKLRQPLSKATIAGSALSKELQSIVQDELNVKELEFIESKSIEVSLETNLTDDLKREGDLREIIRQIQVARKKHGLTVSDVPTIALNPGRHTELRDYLTEKKQELSDATRSTVDITDSTSDAQKIKTNFEEELEISINNGSDES